MNTIDTLPPESTNTTRFFKRRLLRRRTKDACIENSSEIIQNISDFKSKRLLARQSSVVRSESTHDGVLTKGMKTHTLKESTSS